MNLPQFGVAVAPGLLQSFMVTWLAGITGVTSYYDDVPIVGTTIEDFIKRFREAFRRIHMKGLRLKSKRQIDEFSIKPARQEYAMDIDMRT